MAVVRKWEGRTRLNMGVRISILIRDWMRNEKGTSYCIGWLMESMTANKNELHCVEKGRWNCTLMNDPALDGVRWLLWP